MDTALEWLTWLHFAALGAFSLYGLHRLVTLRRWWELRGGPTPTPSLPADYQEPMVTVQLPVFNERFVIARLIDCVARLDWPEGKLEIQVLDDSIDETTAIVEERVAYWLDRGTRIAHIRRTHRGGYKAGALTAGTAEAKGEFIAIFDADFTPTPDFLRNTMPHFADGGVGMVQIRWSFDNADHSWLTRIQAMLLGAHFSVEHQVRYRRKLFFNFNGTAGVWRRRAIEEAGGWQSDTVTEDLDLSYRAQLSGWRFIYLDSCEAPSELPITLSALRRQQQRWAKGSVQTARKLLPRILGGPWPSVLKVEAVAHLLANVCWLLGVVIFLTLHPAVLTRVGIGPWQIVRIDLPLFMATSFAVFLFFAVHSAASGGRVPLRHAVLLPVLTIGLAPAIALSVLGGMWMQGGAFRRTPKFGAASGAGMPPQAGVYHHREWRHVAVNFVLFFYSLLPLQFAWERGTWYAVPFFSLFPLGFMVAILAETREKFGAANGTGA
ncbi:MAG: glycosyltransferase [Nitrospinae bacterium]|nr:glycosyltransferase [Nitrospinota bacterium]